MTTQSKQQNDYKTDLLRKINKIDLWLDDNKEFFNPFIISDHETSVLHKKSFCEYSLYLYVCNQHSIKDNSLQVKEDFFTNLHNTKFLKQANRNTDLFMAFGLPVAVAQNLNKSTPELNQFFLESLNSSHSKSLELLPFRMMDYVFAAQIYKVDKHIYPVNALYKMSNYCRLPDPVLTDESQAYALTHNIFYLTGMTKQSDFFDVNLDFDQGVDKTLNALLLKYVAKQDLDLSLEILASLALTGHCKKWHLDLILDEIDKAIIDDTIIPGPTGRIGADVADKFGEKFYSWVQHYHTMIVAAMTLRILYDQLDDILQQDAVIDSSTLYSCGQALRLAEEYNLPILLALMSSIEKNLDDIKHAGLFHIIENIHSYIESQRRLNNELGFFLDEKNKAEAINPNFEQQILTAISSIDKQIDWQKFETKIAV